MGRSAETYMEHQQRVEEAPLRIEKLLEKIDEQLDRLEKVVGKIHEEVETYDG